MFCSAVFVATKHIPEPCHPITLYSSMPSMQTRTLGHTTHELNDRGLPFILVVGY